MGLSQSWAWARLSGLGRQARGRGVFAAVLLEAEDVAHFNRMLLRVRLHGHFGKALAQGGVGRLRQHEGADLLRAVEHEAL